MNNVNSVFLVGNIGSVEELKTTYDRELLVFSMATTQRYKTAAGEWNERTEWHRITVWGDQAARLAKTLAKGMRVYVDGALRSYSYEKNGKTIRGVNIEAKRVILCGGKPQQQQQQRRRPEYAFGSDGFSEDDLPF